MRPFLKRITKESFYREAVFGWKTSTNFWALSFTLKAVTYRLWLGVKPFGICFERFMTKG